MKRIQIISAPSILGLKPTGVEQLANTLLRTGRFNKLNPIEPFIELPTLNANYDIRRDPKTDCLNPEAIRQFSKALMQSIGEQIDSLNFSLVLGGDCSILIGVMAGLRSKGNFGLIFLDAHADFYEPSKSITGEVADMDLAIVTGRGPVMLTDIDQLKPYVADKHVIHIGQRDAEETRQYGSQDIAETDIRVFDFATIQTVGINQVIDEVAEYMDELDVDRYWIHFDTDLISDDENPAVDYRLAGGITFKEAEYILRRLVKTGRIAGMTVTIFNPALDKTGKIAMSIADCLVHALEE